MDCLNFTADKKYNFHSTKVDEYRKNGNMIIHWLPVSKDLVKISVRMPDNKIVTGLAEPYVQNLKEGDIVQFTRFGFCRLDNKEKMEFWFINR